MGWTGAARAVPSGGRRCETAADGRRCSPGTRRSRAAAANPHRGDPHPKPPPLRAAGKARPRLARRWGWGWLCALGAALPRDGSTQRSRVTEQICDDQTTVESGQERNTRLGRVHQRRSSPTGAVPIGESGAQRDPCAVAPRLSTGRWEGTCFSTDGAATHRPVTAAGEHARLRTAARLLPALMTWPPCPHLSPQLRLSSPTAPLMGRDWGGGGCEAGFGERSKARGCWGLRGVAAGAVLSRGRGDAQQCWQLSQTRGGLSAWGTPCSAVSGPVESLPLWRWGQNQDGPTAGSPQPQLGLQDPQRSPKAAPASRCAPLAVPSRAHLAVPKPPPAPGAPPRRCGAGFGGPRRCRQPQTAGRGGGAHTARGQRVTHRPDVPKGWGGGSETGTAAHRRGTRTPPRRGDSGGPARRSSR